MKKKYANDVCVLQDRRRQRKQNKKVKEKAQNIREKKRWWIQSSERVYILNTVRLLLKIEKFQFQPIWEKIDEKKESNSMSSSSSLDFLINLFYIMDYEECFFFCIVLLLLLLLLFLTNFDFLLKWNKLNQNCVRKEGENSMQEWDGKRLILINNQL